MWLANKTGSHSLKEPPSKVLFLSLLPSNLKETVFQILNRTIWTQNKAHKLGMILEPRCLCCEEVDTMEHLLCGCKRSSVKIWDLLGRLMTLAISQHTGDYIPNFVLTSLEIIFNEIIFKKSHPSIFFAPYWRCLNSKGPDHPPPRNQTWHYLPPCTAANTEKKRRTAWLHSGQPCLSGQQDNCSAWISRCITVFWLAIPPVANHTSSSSYPPLIIHTSSFPHLTYIQAHTFSLSSPSTLLCCDWCKNTKKF